MGDTQNKKQVAIEILFLQKVAMWSLGVGLVVTLACFLLFRPFKFDDDKYSNWSPSYSVLGASTPYEMVEGFFDYTDGEVSWYADAPRRCYNNRKDYLLGKMWGYGLYAAIASFIGIAGVRYFARGQKWLHQTANS